MTHGNRRQALGRPDWVHTVRVGGKLVYFEFGYRFGPLLTDARGEPLDRQPVAEDDPFWAPFEAWLAEYEKSHPRGAE